MWVGVSTHSFQSGQLTALWAQCEASFSYQKMDTGHYIRSKVRVGSRSSAADYLPVAAQLHTSSIQVLLWGKLPDCSSSALLSF